MKKILFYVQTYFLMILFCTAGFGETKEIAKILPENTQILITIKSVENTFQSIGLTEKTFYGESVATLRKEVVKKTGFDLLDLESLKKTGVDTKGTLGFAMGGISWDPKDQYQVNFYMSFFIPVLEEKTAVVNFKKLLMSKKPKISIKSDQNVFYIENAGKRIYFFTQNGFLFFIVSEGIGVQELIQSFGNGKKLSENPQYKGVITKIKPDEDFFVYFDFKSLALNFFANMADSFKKQGMANPLKSLELLKDYEGIGASMNIKSKDLVLKSIVNLRPGSELLAMFKDIPVNRDMVLSIPENMGFFISAAMDIAKYAALLGDFMPEEITGIFKKGADEFKLRTGLDIKEDFLSNLDGNINLSIYDGKSISMFNYNTLLTIGIKDAKKMQQILDKLFTQVPEESKNMIMKEGNLYLIGIFGMVQITVGVKEKNLIIASSKSLFDQTGGTSPSFVSKIKDQTLSNMLKSKIPFIFYINASEVIAAARNFMAMAGTEKPQRGKKKSAMQDWEKYASLFDYFLMTGGFEENTGTGDLIIKTHFKEPFFKALSKIFSSKAK